MESKYQSLIELAKYPMLVLSIVLGVLILKYTMGLEFGMVTELSTNGLKFSEQSNKATLEAITELELKLKELTLKVDSFVQTENAPSQASESELFSASQEVSDATATIAALKSGVDPKDQDKLSGYIWIGDHNEQWGKSSLARIDTGQVNDIHPDKMVAGTQFRVLGNMVVRESLPPNNEQYYRASKNIGVIPKGKIVTLLSAPKAIDREFAVQYWVKVEVSDNL